MRFAKAIAPVTKTAATTNDSTADTDRRPRRPVSATTIVNCVGASATRARTPTMTTPSTKSAARRSTRRA